MIKILIVFVVFVILLHVIIDAWRNMSGMARWTLTKSIVYSIIVALLVVMVMTGLVFLF